MQIDFDIPKRVPSLKPKPEVDFRLWPPSGKIDMTSQLRCVLADVNKIWYADAKYCAHDEEQLQIETGNRILIRRTSVFETGKKQ